jgi:hypothetical protein
MADMTLASGMFQSYDFDRMVVMFTMMDDDKVVPCAISTSAMDDLEKSVGTKAGQREAQFLRLRGPIETRAARKFLDNELEGTPPGVVLRSLDFR